MTCTLRFVPLPNWPHPTTKNRRNSPFSADYTDTLTLLKRELEKIGAKTAEVRIPYQGTDLREDGMPRAKARAMHPGVEVSATTRYGLLRFHGDALNDWKANLRAIALHLEHLRVAQLYGVGTKGEAYQGYMAELPPPPSSPPPAQTAPTVEVTPEENAAALLLRKSGVKGDITFEQARQVRDRPETLASVYRAAAARNHPDRGGSENDMRSINNARDLLKTYQEKNGT